MKKKNIKKNNTKKPRLLFRFKGPMFIITTIIISLIMIIFGTWIWVKSTDLKHQTFDNTTSSIQTTKGEVIYTEGDANTLPTLSKKDKDGNLIDDFKVAVIGDMHLEDDNHELPFLALENYIKIESPDLVVLNGDISLSASNSWPKKLNEMFERNNQYWTFTLGNHDGQDWRNKNILTYDQSRERVFNDLCGMYDSSHTTPSPHCLARTRTNDGAKYGYGNNCINIVGKDSKCLKSLFFFDCSKIQKQNQDMVSWYISTLPLTNNANSVAITHIPFKEMRYAVDNINKDNDVKYLCGIMHEDMCNAPESDGLFDAFKTNGKTKDVIFSHDHVCNMGVEYKGIRMQYSLGFSYNSYSSRNSTIGVKNTIAYMLDDSIENFFDGATNIYVLNKDGIDKSEIGNTYAQWNGTFNGIEGSLYSKFHTITYKGHWLTILNRVLFSIVTAGGLTYYGFLIHYHVSNKKKAK